MKDAASQSTTLEAGSFLEHRALSSTHPDVYSHTPIITVVVVVVVVATIGVDNTNVFRCFVVRQNHSRTILRRN